MKLIVGLGNPGKKYQYTRHNIGFDTIDILADSLGVSIDKEFNNALYCRTKYQNNDIILVKPLTFMNLSGQSVVQFVNYFKINIEDVYVIHDEMDFKPGEFRIKTNGSGGGHNGVKSIIQNLSSDKFVHVRIGIGRPISNDIEFVLSKPSKEEKILIDECKIKAVEAIKYSLKEGIDKAMSVYNKK